MASTEIPAFYLGDVRIEPSLNRIIREGKTWQIEPRVMQVLRCLAERPGEVLDKETLIRAAWTGDVVSDDVLSRAVSLLRKALGDDRTDPHFIETIRTVGYRLIVPVSSMPLVPADQPARPAGGPSAEQGHPERSDQAPMAPSTVAEEPRRNIPAQYVLWGVLLLAVGGLLFMQIRRSSPGALPAYHITPLTTEPGLELYAAPSPDGQYVAFAGTDTTAGPSNLNIYVKLIGTETRLRLTDDPANERAPVWSPDGRQLAFMRHTVDGCGIYLIAALGGPERRLLACTPDTPAALSWSPTGAWLAYSERTGHQGPYHITLLSPTTLEKRGLTAPPQDHFGDAYPAFSPDGQYVAFTRYMQDHRDMVRLHVVPVTGGPTTQLTFDNQSLFGHDWTPDGEAVVYASDRQGVGHLWTVPMSGGTPVSLLISDREIWRPRVFRAANRIVYSRVHYDVNLWRYDTTSPDAPPIRLIASTYREMHPRYAPANDRIAFTSDRTGHYEIWVSDAEGGQQHPLTHFGGAVVGTPRWSPDGQALVFEVYEDGQYDLYVMALDEAMPRRVTTTEAHEIAASWSPDGQWIYFSSNAGAQGWQVWKKPLSGGPAVQVTTDGGRGAEVSPDGQFVYYAKPEQVGLWRRPVAGGREEQVVADLSREEWGNWGLTEAGVYYAHRHPISVRFYDVATGQTRQVFTPRKSIPAGKVHMSVSSDGVWILYGQTDQLNGDLMLVDLETPL